MVGMEFSCCCGHLTFRFAKERGEDGSVRMPPAWASYGPIDMVKTYRREKLLNAIVFFAANTRYCGKTKLYKLLYLLDFEHYKATGRSVTGLEYYAWQMGPVPAKLDGQLDEPSGDLYEAVRI